MACLNAELFINFDFVKVELGEKTVEAEESSALVATYLTKISKLNRKLMTLSKKDDESYIEIMMPSPLSLL